MAIQLAAMEFKILYFSSANDVVDVYCYNGWAH